MLLEEAIVCILVSTFSHLVLSVASPNHHRALDARTYARCCRSLMASPEQHLQHEVAQYFELTSQFASTADRIGSLGDDSGRKPGDVKFLTPVVRPRVRCSPQPFQSPKHKRSQKVSVYLASLRSHCRLLRNSFFAVPLCRGLLARLPFFRAILLFAVPRACFRSFPF